jgi:hypothetical protein
MEAACAAYPQWFDYRTEKLDKLIDGEPVDEKLPVEFLHAVMTLATALRFLFKVGIAGRALR